MHISVDGLILNLKYEGDWEFAWNSSSDWCCTCYGQAMNFDILKITIIAIRYTNHFQNKRK